MRWEGFKLRVPERMGAGCGQNRDLMFFREARQPPKVRDDLQRPRDEQGAAGLEKVALSVDVNEDLRAVEHGRSSFHPGTGFRRARTGSHHCDAGRRVSCANTSRDGTLKIRV